MEGRMEGREEGRMEGREEGRMEGREEGIQEGIKRGIKKGQTETMLANARKMKSYGLAWDMIAEITGLTIEEVKDLE